MTPLSANARGLTGRRGILSDTRSYHVCSHAATFIEPASRGSIHHAALRCACCGCFLRWLPKPSTLDRQKLNAFRLAKLSMHPALTDREREFVANVAQCRKLSPRQHAVLDRLVAAYLQSARA